MIKLIGFIIVLRSGYCRRYEENHDQRLSSRLLILVMPNMNIIIRNEKEKDYRSVEELARGGILESLCSRMQ
jgi:hypothetical protein